MRRFGTLAFGVALGVVIGAGFTLGIANLQARQFTPAVPSQTIADALQNQPPTRLVEIPAPRGQARLEDVGTRQVLRTPAPGLVFFKDLKSDGCWLATLGDRNEAIAIAAAPVDACR